MFWGMHGAAPEASPDQFQMYNLCRLSLHAAMPTYRQRSQVQFCAECFPAVGRGTHLIHLQFPRWTPNSRFAFRTEVAASSAASQLVSCATRCSTTLHCKGRFASETSRSNMNQRRRKAADGRVQAGSGIFSMWIDASNAFSESRCPHCARCALRACSVTKLQEAAQQRR